MTTMLNIRSAPQSTRKRVSEMYPLTARSKSLCITLRDTPIFFAKIRVQCTHVFPLLLQVRLQLEASVRRDIAILSEENQK